MGSQSTGALALEAICQEGWAHHRAGRLDKARKAYNKVLLRDPKHFDSLRLLGALHLQSGQFEAGLPLLRRAIRVNPAVAHVHCHLGDVLTALGRPEEALQSFEKALALAPQLAEAHHNRGQALQTLGRPAEALESYDAAIALNSRHPLWHNNRGLVLAELNRPQDALASYDAALALKPDYVEALANRSVALLVMGRFEIGWPAFEARKLRDRPRRTLESGRFWTGEADLAGRRLFLHHEQGLGDSIQFVRYLPLLEEKGAKIILSAQDTLAPLLRSSFPAVELIGEDETPEDFDFHCPLPSLPLALSTRLETIPAPQRYLGSEPARRARFEALLGERRAPRIGLAWSGNPAHKNDLNRSIPFAQLAPLLTGDAQWIALQNEIRADDLGAFRQSGKVAFLGDALGDFADAAALTDLMDLVISVDTSLVHLAGALGKPVWILLPFSPDWRWMLGRDDSPWYPSARLFRQPGIGDWNSVLETVAAALGGVAVGGDGP